MTTLLAGVLHNFIGSVATHLLPEEHKMLSLPQAIFNFDMTKPGTIQPEATKSVEFVANESGTCNAVCIWFALQLDEHERIESAPQFNTTSERTHWPQTCYVLPAGITCLACE
jgi:hypothetical protein